MNRQDLKTMISIITGHCTLRKHLSVMGLSDEPTCPKCGTEDDTPEHLILTCSHYSKIRREVFGVTPLSSSQLKCTNVCSLLRLINTSGRFRGSAKLNLSYGALRLWIVRSDLWLARDLFLSDSPRT